MFTDIKIRRKGLNKKIKIIFLVGIILGCVTNGYYVWNVYYKRPQAMLMLERLFEEGADIAVLIDDEKSRYIDTWEEFDKIRYDDIVTLDILDISLTDREWKLLRFLPNLSDLRINNTKITNSGFRSITKIPRLKRLYLCRENLSKVNFHGLYRLKSLEYLGFVECKNGKWNSLSQQYIPSLITLTISICDIKTDDLTFLASFPNLESLYITSVPIDDGLADYLSENKKLKVLYLGENKVTGHFFEKLKAPEKYETIWIWRNDISDEGIPALKNFTNLKDLALTGNNISNKSLPIFLSMEHLLSCDISKTSIDEEGKKQLAEAMEQNFYKQDTKIF